MYFGVLGFLIIAVQVFFAVDAYKKGRYYWVWIIFFFSMIACLVYFFVEYLPDLQASRLSEKISSNLEKIIAPEKELKRLKEQLEFCDNVENRTALAEAYMTNHQFSEAIPLLEACLQGHYRDDEYLIEKLSFAYFMTKAYAK
ncbi:MAG: hypothetical protein KC684_09740, partial [Candidatus Omnitrophica bacterium]|nr:hypothetical protein [Candidatus Omnitrophota bacterium]